MSMTTTEGLGKIKVTSFLSGFEQQTQIGSKSIRD
jgi:hypothetical protein